MLFRIGMSYLPSREDVEDAMQNTWMKSFEKKDKFKNQSKFTTWICRIMINECLMQIRKSKRLKVLYKEGNFNSSFLDDPAHRMTKQQVILWMEEAVQKLPPVYRSVYMIREIEGMTVEESANILNVSVENVKVRLHRAKKILKQELISRVPVSELFEYHRRYCDKLTARILTRLHDHL